MSQEPLLRDQVAVVTGAARGIGRAIAAGLAEAGATVVVADIQAADAAATATAIGGTAVACDVTDEQAVSALVSGVVERQGRLDVMVAAAGIADVAPLVEMSLEQWRRVLRVNLDGVFLCTKHAGAAMAAAGRGSIINVASIKAFGGAPAIGHYAASKAGVVSLTKTAALELREHGVRVNAICPGWIDTDMVRDRVDELEAVLGVAFEEVIGHLQGRLGRPEEVAPLAVFLASQRSRFSTGSTYLVDGGATASLV